MNSPDIVVAALATIFVGAAALRYQATGRRRFEMAIILFGVATVASGVAMFRDGVAGSREFLWMLPAAPLTAAADGVRNSLAIAPTLRAAALID